MATAQVPLSNAIITMLQQDPILAGQDLGAYGGLAKHPENAALPAIFLNSILDVSAPVYDCLTILTENITPVKAFEDAAPGLPTSPVEEYFVGFHAYSSSPSANIAIILGVLETHFRNSSFTLIGGAQDGGNAACFRSSFTSSMPGPVADKNMSPSVWFGYSRYIFHIQR